MSTAITLPSRRFDGRRAAQAILAVILAFAVALSVMVWMSRGNSAPVAVRQPAQVTGIDTGSAGRHAALHSHRGAIVQAPSDSPAGLHGRQIVP